MSTKEKTFLEKYMNGAKEKTIYEPWESGFLCIQYDEDGEIMQLAFVDKKGKMPDGNQLQLYFMLINDMVTFKSENSLSGTCWSNGRVDWGMVYDDDDYDGSNAIKCDLDVWINECIKEMCLPENQ